MAATLVLGQDVDLGLGLLVGRDGLGGGQDLAALDSVLLNAAQEDADVVTGHTLVEQLAEHLDAGHDGRGGVLKADDLDGLVQLDDAALDTTRGNGAAASDREHVLDGHQEGLVDLADGLRDLGVDRVHQVADRLHTLGLAVKGRRGRAADDLGGRSVKLVLGQEVADLFLDELEELGVVDQVDLVQEDDDLRHADLAGEEDVLARLGHRAVSGGDHEDSAIHLGGARDHVLDEVGVSRAIDVGVVALRRLVFHVGHGDRDDLGGVTDGAALRDVRVRLKLCKALV